MRGKTAGLHQFDISGPGRQVQDSTFFQTAFRQKLNSIVEETKRLNAELDNTVKENSNYLTFEKKYLIHLIPRADGLAAELRDLQGELGDYNTLVDKLQTDASLEEFDLELVELGKKNANYTATLDAVFMKKKEKEAFIKKAEEQILEEQQKAEALIKTLVFYT